MTKGFLRAARCAIVLVVLLFVSVPFRAEADSPSGSEPAKTPTVLTVSPSSWATDGKTVTVMATLKDSEGNPVRWAEMRFLLEAGFAGTKGSMEIGVAKTDANGVAALDFKPTLAADRYAITAVFAGMGTYGESQQAIELQATAVPPPAYTMEPVGLDIIPPWARPITLGAAQQPAGERVLDNWATSGLALVVLIIWSTFGFVLYQAFGVLRASNGR